MLRFLSPCLCHAKIANEYQWGLRHHDGTRPSQMSTMMRLSVHGPRPGGRRSPVALGKNTGRLHACMCVCSCIDIVFININVRKAPGPGPGPGPRPGTCAPDEILILFYLGFCLAEQNLREVNHTTLTILPVSKDEENGIKTPSDFCSGQT